MRSNSAYLRYACKRFFSISRGYTKNIINRLLLKVYDPLTIRSFLCSIGDLMLEREKGIYNRQFIVICRLLDIERYRTTNDISFPLQNKLTSATSDKRNDLNKKFHDLIESVDRKGYYMSSTLTVNNKLFLLDGTHRAAMMLEKGIDVVQVRGLRRKCILPTECFFSLKTDLLSNDFCMIYEKYKKVNSSLIDKGICFGVWIEDNTYKDCADIISLLKPFVCFHKVLFVENANDSFNGFNFNNGAYALFTPNMVDYVIKRDGYYSNYIKKLKEHISAHYLQINKNPDFFYLTNNCLEGQTIYKIASKALLSSTSNIDSIYG